MNGSLLLTERPYRSTMTAIASWSAAEMEADPSDGDFLLLVDVLPADTSSFRMHCAVSRTIPSHRHCMYRKMKH